MLGLGGVFVAMLLSGWFLPGLYFLALSTVVACLLGILALGAALKSALRGDRLARAVTFSICCMLILDIQFLDDTTGAAAFD